MQFPFERLHHFIPLSSEEPKKDYRALMERMKTAYEANHYVEAVWLAYVVIEDRLGSALRHSGGATFGNQRPIQTLGPKLGELGTRRERDALLGSCFSAELLEQIHEWKTQREALIQSMEEYSSTFGQIQKEALHTAQRGIALANLASIAARNLKKQRRSEAAV